MSSYMEQLALPKLNLYNFPNYVVFNFDINFETKITTETLIVQA